VKHFKVVEPWWLESGVVIGASLAHSNTGAVFYAWHSLGELDEEAPIAAYIHFQSCRESGGDGKTEFSVTAILDVNSIYGCRWHRGHEYEEWLWGFQGISLFEGPGAFEHTPLLPTVISFFNATARLYASCSSSAAHLMGNAISNFHEIFSRYNMA